MQVLDPRACDAEIKDAARWAVGRVKTVLSTWGAECLEPTTPDNLGHRLSHIATSTGAKPIQQKGTITGTIARMLDPSWWTKNLRRETLKANEGIEHAAGLIRRKHQVYVSDHASKIKRMRAAANRRTLEGLEVVSDCGEVVNLQDAADASVSNPKHRRAELMTRCRGFEEMAEFHQHAGLFLTLTTPSRYHRINFAGIPNKKWKGATPRDGQDYLCAVWARTRAAWAKAGIAPYGFRVAEPHHDGTPHWHILLFVAAGQVAELTRIARGHALRDMPTESGAQKRRFTVQPIDPSKGSATGYIAKYISKNIDGAKENGEGMGRDYDAGKDATSTAPRVKDWAATWGIRQFQQVGGPSVTVYRELRRLGKDAEKLQLELFEKPRAAAVEGSYFLFWLFQGGPQVKRQDLPLKPFYVADDLGKYGDLTPKIKGIHGHDATGEYVELTRLKTWTVQRAGLDAVNDLQAEWDERLATAQKLAGFVSAYSDFEFQRSAASTRTGINNCTGTTPPAFDFSKFEESDPDDVAHLYIRGDMAEPWDVMQDVWAAEAAETKFNREFFR